MVHSLVGPSAEQLVVVMVVLMVALTVVLSVDWMVDWMDVSLVDTWVGMKAVQMVRKMVALSE